MAEKSVKELVNDIKEGFAAFVQKFNVQEEPKKFSEAALKDGTIVKTEGELNVGSELYVVQPGGEDVPAPDGVHELADGTMVTTEGGIITDLQKPQAATIDEAKMKADITEAVKAEVQAAFNKQLADAVNEMQKVNEQLFALVEKIAEDAPEPKEEKKSFSKQVQESKQGKVDVLAKIIEEKQK